jgi:diguanylate cyclase (GGDEF)-like protein
MYPNARLVLPNAGLILLDAGLVHQNRLKSIVDFFNILYNLLMNFSDKMTILSRTGLFNAWDEKSLGEVAEFCSPEHFPRGSFVFKFGEDGNAFYIVEDGEITVTRPAETGQEQEIARYIAGESFGELDMLMQTPWKAEARAAQTSELLRFPCRDKSMGDFLEVHPAAGARLLDSFLRIAAGRMRKANMIIAENSSWVQEMRGQVYRDKLTGLFNKTFLIEQLPSFLKDEPLSLIIVKPDNFQEINDIYGQEARDEALIITSAALSRMVTETVEVCRIEGDEFACVFPGMDMDAARDIAEIIRAMLNNLDLSTITSSSTFHLSVSIGIAVYPCYADNAGKLIALAHEMLPIARSRGGNIILFPDDK